MLFRSQVESAGPLVPAEEDAVGRAGRPDTAHLFKKYHRGASAMHLSGSGLGLAIVKNIMEGLGGKVWFESEENLGTSFFLEFVR